MPDANASRAPRDPDILNPATVNPGTLGILADLVGIDSVNPSLVEGAAGEAAAARYVAAWGRDRKLEVTWLEGVPGRPSVVLRAPGTGGGRTLMLNGHLDTVGVDGMEDPFTPRVEGGHLYGRGAADMKASLAASLAALERARGLGLRGDVLVAAVADEEHGSIGTEEVLTRFGADAAVVTEPSGLELHLAHRGFVVVEIDSLGEASHTSQPERGVNAVAHMGRVMVAVERLQDRLRATSHALVGPGGAQLVRVQGGEQLFVTPSACTLTLERRTVPGVRGEDVDREVEALLREAGAGVRGFRAAHRRILEREPFEVDAGEAIVEVVRAELGRVLGSTPIVAGAPYWTDAALHMAAGIPTVIVGPSGAGLHAADEHVELASVALLEEALVGTIAAFCA